MTTKTTAAVYLTPAAVKSVRAALHILMEAGTTAIGIDDGAPAPRTFLHPLRGAAKDAVPAALAALANGAIEPNPRVRIKIQDGCVQGVGIPDSMPGLLVEIRDFDARDDAGLPTEDGEPYIEEIFGDEIVGEEESDQHVAATTTQTTTNHNTRSHHVTLTGREVSTILAALRLWETTPSAWPADTGAEKIDGDPAPLTGPASVDDLCQRVNFGDPPPDDRMTIAQALFESLIDAIDHSGFNTAGPTHPDVCEDEGEPRWLGVARRRIADSGCIVA